MTLYIRTARREDLLAIVQLLGDDSLGKQREIYQDPLHPQYYTAFEEIAADKNNYLIVVENEGKIIGTLQFTTIVYLTYQGGKRGLKGSAFISLTVALGLAT